MKKKKLRIYRTFNRNIPMRMSASERRVMKKVLARARAAKKSKNAAKKKSK